MRKPGRPKQSQISRAEQLRLAQRQRHAKIVKKGKKRLCVYVSKDALAKFREVCRLRKKAHGEVLEDFFWKLDEFLGLDIDQRLYWPKRALEEALYQFSLNEGYKLCHDYNEYLALKATIDKYVAYAEGLLIKWDGEREQKLLPKTF